MRIVKAIIGWSSRLVPSLSSGDGGKVGKFTDEAGFLSYLEICLLKAEGGWRESEDSDGNPYMVKGNQWVGYDSPANVRRKMEYVKGRGLGGAMIWAVDLDDYLGLCGSRWPLLSVMNRQLRREETSLTTENCSHGYFQLWEDRWGWRSEIRLSRSGLR